MPLINISKIDIKNMRSIICKSLIIYEIENKDEIEQPISLNIFSGDNIK